MLLHIAIIAAATYAALALKSDYKTCAETRGIKLNGAIGGWKEVDPKDANEKLLDPELARLIAKGEVSGAWMQTVNGINFLFQSGNGFTNYKCNMYYKDLQGKTTDKGRFWTDYNTPKWKSCAQIKGISSKQLMGGWRKMDPQEADNKLLYPGLDMLIAADQINEAWVQSVNGMNFLFQQGSVNGVKAPICHTFYKDLQGHKKKTGQFTTMLTLARPKVMHRWKSCVDTKGIPVNGLIGGWKIVSPSTALHKIKSYVHVSSLNYNAPVTQAWIQTVNGDNVLLETGGVFGNAQSKCLMFYKSINGKAILKEQFNAEALPKPFNYRAPFTWLSCSDSIDLTGWDEIDRKSVVKELPKQSIDRYRVMASFVKDSEGSSYWIQYGLSGYSDKDEPVQCVLYHKDLNGNESIVKQFFTRRVIEPWHDFPNTKPVEFKWEPCYSTKDRVVGGFAKADVGDAIKKIDVSFPDVSKLQVSDAWLQLVNGYNVLLQIGSQCRMYQADFSGVAKLVNTFNVKQKKQSIKLNKWKSCGETKDGWHNMKVTTLNDDFLYPGFSIEINKNQISSAWFKYSHGKNYLLQMGGVNDKYPPFCYHYYKDSQGNMIATDQFSAERSTPPKPKALKVNKWTPCHVTKKIYDRGLFGGWKRVSAEVAVNKVRYPGLSRLPITDAWMQTVNGDNILIQQGNLSDDVPLNCMLFNRALSGKVTLTHQFQSPQNPVYSIWKMATYKWDKVSDKWIGH